MNNLIVLEMGLPMEIRNEKGDRATIELNKGNFVVCRYHPNNTAYLNDAKLVGWLPINPIQKKIYLAKLRNSF